MCRSKAKAIHNVNSLSKQPYRVTTSSNKNFAMAAEKTELTALASDRPERSS